MDDQRRAADVSLGVESIPASHVYASLAAFVVFYTGLLIIEMYLMLKYIRSGRAAFGTGRYFGEPAVAVPILRSGVASTPRSSESDGGQPMIFDYATLKRDLVVHSSGSIIVTFALTDGWDLGIGMLSPLLGKTDDERRVILRSIEPNWEGNQTWLVIAGGVDVRRVAARVCGGIFRACTWRCCSCCSHCSSGPWASSTATSSKSRAGGAAWDWGLFIGGFVPTLVFGIAFGNLLLGVPFQFDRDLRVFYYGHFLGLLNPFALLAGVVSVAMLIMHGAAYLQLRMDGIIQARAARAARLAALALIVTFGAAGVWVATGVDGYRVTSMPDPNSVINPLAKSVMRVRGAWLDNYIRFPLMLAAPVAAFAGALGVALLATAAPSATDTARQRDERHRRDPHGRALDVSVRHAFEQRPGEQPDGVGRRCRATVTLQTHVLGNGGLPAPDRSLYVVGVLAALGQSDGRNGSRRALKRPHGPRAHHQVHVTWQAAWSAAAIRSGRGPQCCPVPWSQWA